MKFQKGFFVLLILLFALTSRVLAEGFDLPYFLEKASSKEIVMSRTEQTELLGRIQFLMEQAGRIRMRLNQIIQAGEVDVRYQEGTFWMSQLEQDQVSIETAIQQVKILREKPTLLLSTIKLYKSLRDLSSHFSAYNNVPSFSGLVGDLAPELELWTDPVFYQLYLLPLAGSRDKDMESKPPPPPPAPAPPKEKKPVTPPPKGKKP
jgi:hypothetical protein